MDLENALILPDACCIRKTVFKKLFTENGDLKGSDRTLFTDVVDKVTWLFCLKPETINIQPYADEEREYPEIEIIEVALLQEKAVRRIAEIVMRSIPYPMVLVFSLDGRYQIWTAHQRTNKNRSTANTIDEFVMTGWIDSSLLQKTLDFTSMCSSHYYDLYTDIVDAVSIAALQEIAPETGIKNGKEARGALNSIQSLEAHVLSLRSALSKESQFNRKVELNMEIKTFMIDFAHVGDDLGNQLGPMISMDIFDRHFAPKYAEYFKMVHLCGTVWPFLDRLISIGLDVYDVVQPTTPENDIGSLCSRFGQKILFQGSMDVQHELAFGTPAEVEREVKRRLDLFPKGDLILGPSHAIQAKSPVENIIAMYRTAGSLMETIPNWVHDIEGPESTTMSMSKLF